MSRLSYALPAALALHGLLLLVRARHPAPHSALVPASTEQTIELEAVAAEPQPSEPTSSPLAESR